MNVETRLAREIVGFVQANVHGTETCIAYVDETLKKHVENSEKKQEIYTVGLGWNLFVDGESFFSPLDGAKDAVSHMERLYPANVGLYKIYHLNEVQK